jgi:hypothetical protein
MKQINEIRRRTIYLLAFIFGDENEYRKACQMFKDHNKYQHRKG